MSPMRRRLRLVLALVLSFALDFAGPVGPEALEIFEEFEEAAHRVRSRRMIVLVREERPPSPSPETSHVRLPRPARVGVETSRRSVILHPAREAPPPVAEAPPAPEDH